MVRPVVQWPDSAWNKKGRLRLQPMPAGRGHFSYRTHPKEKHKVRKLQIAENV